MNKKLMNAMAFLLANNSGYSNMNIILDNKVNECLMDLYFYMLYSDVNEEKQEEYFQEFGKKYKKLNKEQQEMVQQDFISIIEAQDKNKEKVKKKGNDKYE